MKKTRIKVALMHNTIAPYRHPFFEALAKIVDLTVYYCSMRHHFRKWDLWPRDYDYKFKLLSRIAIKTPVGEFSLNPTIVNEIIKSKPHIIIISGYLDPTMWLVFAIAKLLKIPMVYWTEGIKEPKSILGMITRPLRMLFVKKTNAIVVPGRVSRSYVISLGASAEKVFIAPNTIDNELFIELSRKYQPDKERLKDKLELKGRVLILCVSQLIRRKGIEYLLYAYGKLEQEFDDIALVIVGSGPLEFHLKDLANSLNLKNFKIIHSGLSLEELIELYSAADIFVLPTLEDVWGFVVNEAMACSLPIIATRASQAAIEMISHGENGYVVREADVESLFNSLKELVCDDKLREKMGKKSRQILMQKFKIDYMVEGFLRAINGVSEK